MKLSVSNIAWSQSEEDRIVEFLLNHGVSGIEVAPTKLWPDWSEATESKAFSYRQKINGKGLEIPALQAILFGCPRLQVFDPSSHNSFYCHMDKVTDLAAAFGAQVIVFGAPKNRRIFSSDTDNQSIALDFFTRLADICKRKNCYVGIENNPVEYGCNFLTTLDEADKFVRVVAHPNVKLHVDSGGMQMDGVSTNLTLSQVSDFCHYHVSEPMLAPIAGGIVDHQGLLNTLYARKYANWVSIEMKEPDRKDSLYSSVRTIGEMMRK